MNDFKYVILKIDKTNCYVPSVCIDVYNTLLDANYDCQYYTENEENEDFEYKVFELKEIMGD